ncbi:TetR/AcrR family transcriptional regulator [Amycolatopsis sp. GM8]|uniref:TetR/AcrR family transcriptional regulator n=1 Tax=Amycolatopsis sp. GM8 TaxID=2896530 RepID=UPI001F3074DB|nr:TetR/AcrR family transcriptional regulator [Amycolatopsis sp. GM8]
MAGTQGKAVRVDARRNRQRLVEVAREAFTTGEDKVSLEAIAREAGVGIGTLYRHFPTREALVEAVYRAERTWLHDSAGELLATLSPDRALRAWMDRFGDYVATKRELGDALRALIVSGTVTSAEARAELSAAAKQLLDAGAAAGTVRADVRAEDVVVGVLGILVACGQRRDQADRLLDLLMDGLRRS